ncbi:MAG: hypothetical protein AAGF50_00750, partial [Pseudomonadota bacterium]
DEQSPQTASGTAVRPNLNNQRGPSEKPPENEQRRKCRNVSTSFHTASGQTGLAHMPLLLTQKALAHAEG